MCAQLDRAYRPVAAHAAQPVMTALGMLNAHLDSPLPLAEALSLCQRALTDRLDQASWVQQLHGAAITMQAILRSEAEPGARAFLAAPPAGRTRMEAAVFVVELRQRLGVADAAVEAWRPRCDSVLDKFSLHAATCSAGGERTTRTTRHNALRDADIGQVLAV